MNLNVHLEKKKNHITDLSLCSFHFLMKICGLLQFRQQLAEEKMSRKPDPRVEEGVFFQMCAC